MNKPYVKEGGIEIKKGQPYIHQYPNRRARRNRLIRLFNNKKGIQLVITYLGKGKFQKVHKDFQRLRGRTIVQYKLK